MKSAISQIRQDLFIFLLADLTFGVTCIQDFPGALNTGDARMSRMPGSTLVGANCPDDEENQHNDKRNHK